MKLTNLTLNGRSQVLSTTDGEILFSFGVPVACRIGESFGNSAKFYRTSDVVSGATRSHIHKWTLQMIKLYHPVRLMSVPQEFLNDLLNDGDLSMYDPQPYIYAHAVGERMKSRGVWV